MKNAVNRKRRLLLSGGAAVAAGAVASSWGTLSQSSSYQPILQFSDRMNLVCQRLLIPHRPLAREYDRSLISKNHPVTGGIGASYIDPNPAYDALAASGFHGWKLQVGGLVERPVALSLEEVRALPARSQITMHSCDEGWSAIGEWTGVQLSHLLNMTGILPAARYVVFHCMDSISGNPCYGTIDLLDAVHPQTLIAYDLNGLPLSVGHGAPLRLRVELQVGYKNSKHIDRIELVESFKDIGGGKGGFSEDVGYQWYAGM